MRETAWTDWSEVPVLSIVDDIECGQTVDDVAEGYGLNPPGVKVLYKFYAAARATGLLRPGVYSEIPVVTGPIGGIPADEVAAWIDAWDTETPLPDPEPRWIDVI